jgi:hypothetical protein
MVTKTAVKKAVPEKATAGLVAVVVTTSDKGVFFGYANPKDFAEKTIRIEKARMCVSWSSSIRGQVGLAAVGPDKQCRISWAAKFIVLQNVTSVQGCTDEAVRQWESDSWA